MRLLLLRQVEHNLLNGFDKAQAQYSSLRGMQTLPLLLQSKMTLLDVLIATAS